MSGTELHVGLLSCSVSRDCDDVATNGIVSTPPACSDRQRQESPIIRSTTTALADAEQVVGGPVVDETVVMRKVHIHLLTRFFIVTIFNYLDRTNLSLAAVQMNDRLGITAQQYGYGSGVFYAGYILSQVPSNIMLERVGAPCWLAVIAVTWGVVATSFACITSVWQFYILRVLLGLAEGGTFPGMWYHMTLFFTEAELGAAYAVVLLGVSMSQVLGSPLAAGLLAMDGFLGIQGWQWLFLIEGMPTVLLGLWLRFTLPRSPLHCYFLKPQQRQWLSDRAAQERKRKAAYGSPSNALDCVRTYRTWWLTAGGSLYATAKFGILYWCPLIIKQLLQQGSVDTPSDVVVSLINTLPFSFAAAFMCINSWHSKKTGEVRYHATVPMLVSAAAFGVLPWLLGLGMIPAILGLMASTAMYSTEALFISFPATFLQGKAAAAGVAVINSLSNIGGFAGPFLIGYIKSHTTSGGGFSISMTLFALLMVMCFFAFVFFPLPARENNKSGHTCPCDSSYTRINTDESHDVQQMAQENGEP